MRTRRTRVRDAGYAACDAVLETPELLETIFSYLDIRTLLLIQAVSSRWRDTVTGSSRLQRALFFIIQPSKSDTTSRTQNPLLAELFSPFFDSRLQFDYGAMPHLPMAATATRLAKFMQPSASWRRMLVSNPPVYKLGCWMTEESFYGELPTHSLRTLTFPHGLRMGKLYDLAQRFLYGNSISARCAISWRTHDVMGLLRFLLPSSRPGRGLEPGATKEDGSGTDVDLVIKASCYRNGAGHPRKYPRGGNKFALRKLSKGTLMDGPASNHRSINNYRAFDWSEMQERGRIFPTNGPSPSD
jgi:hypothetical protein